MKKIRKNQNSKYETYLLNFVDCFIDVYGSVKGEHINFLLIINYLFKEFLSKLILSTKNF